MTIDRNSNILGEKVIRSYILDNAHLRFDFYFVARSNLEHNFQL